MNYQDTLSYLYTSAPLFQHVGQDAYKEGLSTTHILDEHFEHPHCAYHTIHVGGTNGKGSCSHTLAAVLQTAGYKVGLYTSPHLKDFRERIRVNGKPISQQRVIDFVEHERAFFEPLHPSFFELTTALAFLYFKEENVDVAVIEVGLGGRLDCTNIIHPDLSIITNISFDHTQFLGNTLEKIASEKAGIIKYHIPVIIGETGGHKEVKKLFERKAQQEECNITFADEQNEIISCKPFSEFFHTDVATTDNVWGCYYNTVHWGTLHGELGGIYQGKNTATILCAIEELQKIGYKITKQHVAEGMKNVCESTGLSGRWQTIENNPLTICDTGHNVAGISYICEQLKHTPHNRLRIVIGMVNDKDVRGVLQLLPKDALYYFTKASVKRALNENKLAQLAKEYHLHGIAYPTVPQAYKQACEDAASDDLIFIGGSSFIVADLLSYLLPETD